MEAKRNPKDSMRSTWRNDKSSWTHHHWILELLQLHNSTPGITPPVHAKTDKIPFMSNLQQQRWVLFHASIPLLLHQAYVSWTGRDLSRLAAFVLYMVSMNVIGIRQLHSLRRLGERYGFLDGDKHERDGVPDHSVAKVFDALTLTSTIRPLMTILLAYNPALAPSSLHWALLPLQVSLYSITLDFWFYWYHRLMHQVPFLWSFHRTHHLTKHPNPLLTLYADAEQEFFDILGIPLLTYFTLTRGLGLPLGFYEWWVCQQYVVFAEVGGHSGVRVYSTPPSPLWWLLAALDIDLTTEDHDLHHRLGWRKSHNYGKQTRIWDRLFGTAAPRIEAVPENIDYDDRVALPLF